ncbi:MAG TPA: SUMF1/EgtB/PvdO family nonheme iron enzyme, partial [Candidatus Aminicenantes bacterium]|nr:SUMF1/EgtB/PvdO family nonheme iron enzyme [Candidatus Aminicenantes bacterium]
EYGKVYVSIPDSSSSCANLNLPSLPDGYSYKCASQASFRKSDGTGWVPVNFNSMDIGSPLSALPVDPSNIYTQDLNANNDFFYTYTISSDGQQFELNTKLESKYYGFKNRDNLEVKNAASDDAPLADGGDNGLLEKGSSLALMPDSGGLCPTGMIWVPSPGRFCIDKYEATYAASATKPDGTTCSSNCPVSTYNNNPWSTRLSYPNLPQSVSGVNNDAIDYCQNMGKVLPTDFEWWLAAAGTPDPYNSKPSRISGEEGPEPCMIWNTSSTDGVVERPQGSVQTDDGYVLNSDTNPLIKTGTAVNCKSSVGAMDMIGNLWEWTNNVLSCDGAACTYQGITLSSQNYITSINNEGIPLTTGSASTAFNYDYFWTNVTASTYAFLRGAGRSDAEKAGRFSLSVNNSPSDAYYNCGFRCVLR